MEHEDYDRASEVLGELLQVFPTPKAWLSYATCLKSLHRPGWENALLEAIRIYIFRCLMRVPSLRITSGSLTWWMLYLH